MDSLLEMKDVFNIKVTANKLEAEIWCNQKNNEGVERQKWSKEAIKYFLNANKITYGLLHSNIERLAKSDTDITFPLTIAKGTPVENGKDGEIKYSYDTTTEVDRSEGYDFREVMRIPTVKKDQKVAVLILPTKGENGRTVYDTELKAKPGRQVKMRAGKNVRFNQETLTFYADEEGQVSVTNHRLDVHNVYELYEDVSLKTGNIDFLGTVIIRGNVPTGFTIQATGDIKIFGLVEGAKLTSGGSVFITEGMAGIRRGFIKAEENVHLGYINQGKVTAGNSIYVDHSILHSECAAVKTISCKEGNIIGGTLSAGQSVKAKDIGNRMNTVTELSFGVDNERRNRQLTLEKARETEKENLRKLTILMEKLEAEKNLNTKARIMMLKVKKSFEQSHEKINELTTEIKTINSNLGVIEHSFLSVGGTIYPNTTVSFGKYHRTLNKKFDNVTIRMENNEISII